MDKKEYKIRLEQIKELLGDRDYAGAMEVCDVIDWKRVKNVSTLCTVSEIYKINRKYEDARDILLLAYDKNPDSKSIVYALCELSLKLNDIVDSINYRNEYEELAPGSSDALILTYRIFEAQEVSIDERISVLEAYKRSQGCTEKWGYELALLYHRSGQGRKCAEECDEIILTYTEGEYVRMALELKAMHRPLTALQQEQYENILKEDARLKALEEAESEQAAGEDEMDYGPDEEYENDGYYGEDEDYDHQDDYGQDDYDRDGADRDEPVSAADDTGDGPEAESEAAGDGSDIEIKQLNLDKRNSTINIQEELSKGVKEFFESQGEEGILQLQGAGDGLEIYSTQDQTGDTYDDPDYGYAQEDGAGYAQDDGAGYAQDDEAADPAGYAQDGAEYAREPETGAGSDAGTGYAQGGVSGDTSGFVWDEGAEYAQDAEAGYAGYAQDAGTGYAQDAGAGDGAVYDRGTGQLYAQEGADLENEEPGDYYSHEPVEGQGETFFENAAYTGEIDRQTIEKKLGRPVKSSTDDIPQIRKLEKAADEAMVKALKDGKKQEPKVKQVTGYDPDRAATGTLPEIKEEPARRSSTRVLGAGPAAGVRRVIRPENKLNRMLSQDNDGQISMVVPEQQVVEKQITGQMDISGYLSEWERQRKESQRKRIAAARLKTIDQTNNIASQLEKVLPRITGELPSEEELVQEVVLPEEDPQKAKENMEKLKQAYTTGQLPHMSEMENAPDPEDYARGGITPDISAAGVMEIEEIEDTAGFEEYEGSHAASGESYGDTAADDLAAGDGYGDEPGDFAGSEGDYAGREGYPEDDYAGQEGYPEESYEGQEGYPEEGYEGQEGYPEEGYEGQEGYPEDGYAEDGYASEEYPEDAYVSDSYDPGQQDDYPDDDRFDTSQMPQDEFDTGQLDLEGVQTTEPQAGCEGSVYYTDEEYEKLFGELIHVKNMKEKLAEALPLLSMQPGYGNVVVYGNEKSARIDLALGLVKSMKYSDPDFTGRPFKINAKELNSKDIRKLVPSLMGGALVVEDAALINVNTLDTLAKCINHSTARIIIIMEVDKKYLKKLSQLRSYFDTMFDVRIEMSTLSNNDLVEYARKYARDREYVIDDMGVLALHRRIDELQTASHNVTKAEVDAIMDAAMEDVDKKNLGLVKDILFSRRYDKDDLIILREKNFEKKK